MSYLKFDMAELGDDDALAGAPEGAEVFAKLVAAVADAWDERVVLLDFAHVAHATSSFLRESVLGFRTYCRAGRPNLYPVVANPNLKVLEEFETLLIPRGDAVVACETNAKGNVRTARVIGKLETKQRETLRAVLTMGKADAVTLSRKVDGGNTKATAWNNRLAALSAKGILRETQAGRAKVFQPVLEALIHGA
jgi:hypothetical protein